MGDPFKDFSIELRKIESAEATKYIKTGRDGTYRLIDMLYRTDWSFGKKQDGVKIYNLSIDGKAPEVWLRFETKFENITVPELLEFYTNIDKRMAWDNLQSKSIEEVKMYPLQTSIYYMKINSKPKRDYLFLSHRVHMKGDRAYLTFHSVEHDQFPE